MPRPEKPITGDGPVADLARELRQLRDRAGQPSYREMSERSCVSASVLAAAANGRQCPTRAVLRAYVEACGDKEAAWRSRWAEADAAARRSRRRQRRATVAANAGRKPVAERAAERRNLNNPNLPREPDPMAARTPTEFVRQLRALRVWAGQPSYKEILWGWKQHTGMKLWDREVSPSTMYDALSPRRTRLPSVHTVRFLATGCGADVDRWMNAWRALRLQELESLYSPLNG